MSQKVWNMWLGITFLSIVLIALGAVGSWYVGLPYAFAKMSMVGITAGPTLVPLGATILIALIGVVGLVKSIKQVG